MLEQIKQAGEREDRRWWAAHAEQAEKWEEQKGLWAESKKEQAEKVVAEQLGIESYGDSSEVEVL